MYSIKRMYQTLDIHSIINVKCIFKQYYIFSERERQRERAYMYQQTTSSTIYKLFYLFIPEARIDVLCARHPKLIIKSMTGCHRYYNCSGEDTELSRWISIYRLWHSKFEHECHYPFLFSDETMQCENYTKVSCLNRFEPTWECKQQSHL